MGSNRLLKWLVVPAVLLVLVVGIKLTSNRAPEATDTGPRLTPEQMKVLGIEGDTPSDTVATLVGQVKQLRAELKSVRGEDTQQQSEESERWRQRESALDQRIQNALDAERKRQQEERASLDDEMRQTAERLQALQQRSDKTDSAQSELPVGLGLEDGDGKQLDGSLRWVEPDDTRPSAGPNGRSDTHSDTAFQGRFGPAQTALTQPGKTVRHTAQDLDEKDLLKPVYTVPSNSTLMGSIAMTALIGRVPVDGIVNDPFPFKVLIGPDNLTANGIDLPEVAGAVVSGTASGDWTLSCVRASIRTITFVFRDGTVRTVPGNDQEDAGSAAAQQGASGVTTDNSLGWISDPYGIPCIGGERRSNAQQYLGTQALITAAGAGAASLIKSDNGNVAVVPGGTGSLGTVGISGNDAMGRILSGGVSEMTQWVNKLYGQAFAAVYVPPGARVAIHIERPINIDYDPLGRRVNYHTGEAYGRDLD
ncbi:TIGR03752 family integrating conjugative element protein [Lelliottia amnigena]|uniref:TIGR03752 family integrating conjugative element protein n=1 Tax=Lelliottia amnigena TaxID=61646 RepID=UPI004057C8F9